MKLGECYICKSLDYESLYIVRNHTIGKCKNCEFIYVVNRPTKGLLKEFYSTFDYTDSESAESIIRTDAKRSLRIIERYRGEGHSLFDVGCGRGYFLDEARHKGWTVSGIDISSKVVQYAQKKLNLSVLKKDILKNVIMGKFDVLTLNQVIEHVSNPTLLIRRCRSYIKQGGLVYIATPNIESHLSKIEKELFDHIIPPEHLGYFSKKTLTCMLEKLGFEVIYVGSWSYPQDLGGIIKTILGKNKQKYGHTRVATPSNHESQMTLLKNIKHMVFDKFFCGALYNVLNIGTLGTNLEVIARKRSL